MAKAKLNQIIAIEKGVKSRTKTIVDDLYKAVQKPALFNGSNKSFTPNNDDGEKLPAVNAKVQYESGAVLKAVQGALSDLMSVTARKDWTNMSACADIVVDGKVLVSKAPVTYLLFLEKQLTDIRTFLGKFPVLDDAENWTKDENSGLFKSDVIKTHRTKKVQKPLVLYDATDKHPAQTQIITEDEITGYWSEVKISGALQKPRYDLLIDRVETLIRAVKVAREEANMALEVDSPDVGGALFGYLFAKE